jgi:hypothetical protein
LLAAVEASIDHTFVGFKVGLDKLCIELTASMSQLKLCWVLHQGDPILADLFNNLT